MGDDSYVIGRTLEKHVRGIYEAGGKCYYSQPGAGGDGALWSLRGPKLDNAIAQFAHYESVLFEMKHLSEGFKSTYLPVFHSLCKKHRHDNTHQTYGILVSTQRVVNKLRQLVARTYGRDFVLESITEFERRWVDYRKHYLDEFLDPKHMTATDTINCILPPEVESCWHDVLLDNTHDSRIGVLWSACKALGSWLEQATGDHAELPHPKKPRSRVARAPIWLTLDGSVDVSLRSLVAAATKPECPRDELEQWLVFRHLVRIGRLLVVIDASADHVGRQLARVREAFTLLLRSRSGPIEAKDEGSLEIAKPCVVFLLHRTACAKRPLRPGDGTPVAVSPIVDPDDLEKEWDPHGSQAASPPSRFTEDAVAVVERLTTMAVRALMVFCPSASQDDARAVLQILAVRSLAGADGRVPLVEVEMLVEVRLGARNVADALALRQLSGLLRAPRLEDARADRDEPTPVAFADARTRDALAAGYYVHAIEKGLDVGGPINERVRTFVCAHEVFRAIEAVGEWVRIPAGPAIVGGPHWNDTPLRVEYVGEVWMRRYAVQNRERPAGDCGWVAGPDDHPAQGVSLAEAYSWLPRGMRLPTALEWEKAARGPFGRRLPWGDEWPDAAHRRCNTRPFTSGGERLEDEMTAGGVGTTPVTEFEWHGDSYYGVVDLVGNVWEWTCTPTPWAPERMQLRGGSWDYREGIPYPSRWTNYAGNAGALGIGFRPVIPAVCHTCGAPHSKARRRR